jgi:hypothetical protein
MMRRIAPQPILHEVEGNAATDELRARLVATSPHPHQLAVWSLELHKLETLNCGALNNLLELLVRRVPRRCRRSQTSRTTPS